LSGHKEKPNLKRKDDWDKRRERFIKRHLMVVVVAVVIVVVVVFVTAVIVIGNGF